MMSTDEQFVSFNLYKGDQLILQTIDLQGRSYGQIPDAINLAWQPGNGLIYLLAAKDADPGSILLVFWNPISGVSFPVVGPTRMVPVDGGWSPDGQTFAFCGYDPGSKTQTLFNWRLQDQTLQDVQQVAASGAFLCNITWLANSSAYYFNMASGAGTGLVQTLWKYLIASSSSVQVDANPIP